MDLSVEEYVFEALNNASEDAEGYLAELAELSDEAQAEDLIDKTDVVECSDASDYEHELLGQVTAAVKKWRTQCQRPS